MSEQPTRPSNEALFQENKEVFLRVVAELFDQATKPGTYEQPFRFAEQGIVHEYTLSLSIKPEEELFVESGVNIEIREQDAVVAYRHTGFDRLGNGAISIPTYIYVDHRVSKKGLGSLLLSTTDVLIGKVRELFPTTFQQATIYDVFQDANAGGFFDEDHPLTNGWADRELRQEGYEFDPVSILEQVPEDYDFDPYISRLKIYPPEMEAPALATPEIARGIEWINLSGKPLNEVLAWFPHDLRALRVVILPDICPGKAPLPTGCCVTFDKAATPEWRKYTESDIGCGMTVLESTMTYAEFDAHHEKWDQLIPLLQQNKGKLGDLGSGNHFIDAAVDTTDPNSHVFFVIHTGSRNESPTIKQFMNDPDVFERQYQHIVEWAQKNRMAIKDLLANQYGPLTQILDTTHNFYLEDETTVSVYKGAVHLQPNDISIIPSSMDGNMVIVEGTEAMESIDCAISHGTGRTKSTSEGKQDPHDFDELRIRIHVPEKIRNESLRSEHPENYRPLDECLALLSPYVRVVRELAPIAYLGKI